MSDSAQNFIDTIPESRNDLAKLRTRHDHADEDDSADGDYVKRLAWTIGVLAFYIGALALPAAGFIIVGDSSSPVFFLRLWALVPGKVETGFSMLMGGWIELFLGQIGAAGWIANVLFTIGLFRFWSPPSFGFQARSMSSLAIGLALASLPLTNLSPILANEAGWKMAALVPLAGYWLWLASMVTLWVAIRVMPPRESNLVGAWPVIWLKRFALIEKAGGAELPYKAALTWAERIQIRMNIWALVFGAGYYIVKGMWKKGLALGVLGMFITGALVALAPSWHEAIWLVQGVFVLLFGVSANLDFYRLTHGGDAAPRISVRVLVLVLIFMMLLGWAEVLALNYFEVHGPASHPLPDTPFPRMSSGAIQVNPIHGPPSLPDETAKPAAPARQAPPPITSASQPTPQARTSAVNRQVMLRGDQIPFHLGESVAQVQRTVARLPDWTAADFNSEEARYPQQGVWIFFDPNQQIREIRLDPPFDGAIEGIHIGDPISKLHSVLGSPDVPVFAFAGDLAHVYDRSGVAYRFDVGKDAQVERVFIIPERR